MPGQWLTCRSNVEGRRPATGDKQKATGDSLARHSWPKDSEGWTTASKSDNEIYFKGNSTS